MSASGFSVETDLPRTARANLRRLSRAIKAPIETQPYVTFLLRDYRRVREFGRRTHVLDTRLLPPGIRMDPRSAGFFEIHLKAWTKELSLWLSRVVEHGWLYLTPRQYNLVALLKRLSDRITAFDFEHVNLRDPKLIERMRRIESLFLLLQYTPETASMIHTAIATFCERNHEPEGALERVEMLMEQVLAEDRSLPSLYNFILGLNIVKHRRFLQLPDLMREGLEDVVDARDFDCEPAVRSRVEGYIHEALGSLTSLHGQLQEARRIGSYVAFDDLGKPDPTVLWKVYEAGAGLKAFDFDADQTNLVLFTTRLLRGFDTVFTPLLNGQCMLVEAGRVQIFSPSFFERELARLRSLADKLETGPFHFANFPLKRFLAIRSERLDAIGHETEVSQLLNEAVGCLVDLGKTITKVLSLRAPLGAAPAPPVAPAPLAPGGPAPTGPLEPPALQAGAFALPHETHHFPSGTPLAGRTVAEALSAAVTACFTTGLLFRDDFLTMFLGREKVLAADLRQRIKLMENLLEPEKFRELSQRYV